MKLNARQIETAKPRDKAYKLADGGGMYLEIFPSGSKSWRLKYRFAGKEKRVVFGLYAAVSLYFSSFTLPSHTFESAALGFIIRYCIDVSF